jgi:two-component system sensor kinase FixL
VRCEQAHVVRANGREEWVSWEVKPWRLSGGQIGGVVIVSEDITERVRMQQALQDKERRLTAIFDSATEAIVTSDRHGVIVSVNPAARDLFGYALGELLGKKINKLMPERHAARHDSYIDAYLRGDANQIIGRRRMVEGRRQDGEIFPLELTVSEAGSDDERLFVGIMRDLRPIEAERRRVSLLREELAHHSRVNDMGEMVAGLAHEVGQPIAAILNFAAAYRRALVTTGKLPETDLVAKIEEQARRAAEIIKRLRGFIEKRRPERRAVAVESLVDDALNLVHLRSRPRIVRTPPDPEVSGVRVFVDSIQIEQVLINLLRNADDALIDSGAPEITIEISPSDSGRVMVSVADNGVGVDREATAELFDPFFTTKHRGMGVGLSISKSIVESHGGAIFYRPNAPAGSIFEFELPLYAPKARLTRREPP